jgi:ABC-type dipeptide/oligopeptide/nickel transport system ATPase component
LLSVRDLRVRFRAKGCGGGGVVEAVRGVSFSLQTGKILAVVGGSGSGKSVTALALGRLLPPVPECFVSGSICYDGRDVTGLSSGELRRLRGREIAYIFQEPCAALNPAYSIGFQIGESLRIHSPGAGNLKERITQLLEEVGIQNAANRLGAYPHELSGGQAQRVMIAMALCCSPRLLVADEPTTALDATVQRQILDLLARLRMQHKMAILLITHNFGVVSGLADEVAVMADGRIVEHGPVARVLGQPEHATTRTLLAAIPRMRARPGLRQEAISSSQVQPVSRR